MSMIREKAVLDHLEQIALIEPAKEATDRAIAHARRAMLQQTPWLRRSGVRNILRRIVATAVCAAGVAVLLTFAFDCPSPERSDSANRLTHLPAPERNDPSAPNPSAMGTAPIIVEAPVISMGRNLSRQAL